jgi:hypothetical protein
MSPMLILAKCSRCGRIKVNSNWLKEPDFLTHDTLYSHTYCPECLQAEMATVEEYAAVKATKATSPLKALRPVSVS